MATDVNQFLDDWASAERGGDAAALDGLLTADFVGIGPRGFVLDRSQWLDRYRSGDLVNDGFELTERAVRRYGDVAVVTAVQDQDTRYRGQANPGRFRATLVAVPTDDRWQLASLHLAGPLGG